MLIFNQEPQLKASLVPHLELLFSKNKPRYCMWFDLQNNLAAKKSNVLFGL